MYLPCQYYFAAEILKPSLLDLRRSTEYALGVIQDFLQKNSPNTALQELCSLPALGVHQSFL